MRVHYMSDLHLEFQPLPVLGGEGDVLLLAGDITLARTLDPAVEDPKSQSVREATLRLLEAARRNFERIFVIGGNHEPYGADIVEAERLCRRHISGERVRWLENEVVEIGGTLFVFATLWADMSRRDPSAMAEIGRRLSDFYLITADGKRWTPAMAADRFDASFGFIRDQVEAEPGRDVVVVTHHAPTYRGIHPAFGRSELNGGFASALDDFILEHPNIRHWVFGHTHVTMEFDIGATALHANCRGYPRENTGFEFNRYFEI